MQLAIRKFSSELLNTESQTDATKVEVQWKAIKCVFYIPFKCIDWVIALYMVLDQCSHLTVLMYDPQVTNLNSARRMVWTLKCSERWSHVQSTLCPSVLIDLLLSMWCLISAVADSSNSVNGQSTTDQHWKIQMDGVKVVKPLWVYKCSSLCARVLIQLLFITITLLLHDFYKFTLYCSCSGNYTNAQ